MGIMAGQNIYRGDSGALRKALAESGFDSNSVYGYVRYVFNDVAKSRATRRLKLWFAEDVFEAPVKQQRKLERKLKTAFGTRYLGGYFVDSGYRFNHTKSLCIKLTAF